MRSLRCPHCAEEFSFADWREAASCPSCGRRVTFHAAAGVPEPRAPVSNGDRLAARARLALGGATAGEGDERVLWTLGGKPLVWTTAWTMVVIIWAVCALALVVLRVEMGHLTALSLGERAAISQVEQSRLNDGSPTARELLDYLPDYLKIPQAALQLGEPTGKAPRWYALDRPWQKTVAVDYEYYTSEGVLIFSWTVKDGVATPDLPTTQHLEVLATMKANPPAPTTTPQLPQIPQIPGL